MATRGISCTSLCTVSIWPPAGSGFAGASLSNVALGPDHLINVILPLADKWPPVIISQPVVNAISQTEATVSWQTDEPTRGGISYGLADPNGTVVSESRYATRHSLLLTGLAPETTYHASAFATDSTGNGPVNSAVAVFTTKALPDGTPPVLIEGPIVSSISHAGAAIEWRTDEPTAGTVHYGPTDAFGLTAGDSELATAHRVQLAGLSPETPYFVRVDSSDAAGNGPAASAVVGFRTVAAPDLTPPVIVEGPLALDVTDTTVTIMWTTDEPATSAVSWNDGTVYDLVSDPTLSTAHLVTLTNLAPSTAYSFTVSTTDAAGNGPTLGAAGAFTTRPVPDAAPPVFTEITPVFVVNAQMALIKWRTDEPADSVVEYGTSPDALTQIESKAGLVRQHTIPLNHLEAGTVYFFRLLSRDERGNAAASEVMSFQTAARDKERIGGPVVTRAPEAAYASDTSATVVWETDVPTDTVLEFAAEGEPVRRLSDAEKTNRHQVTLTNLTAGSSYGVEVSGADGAGRAVVARLGFRPTLVAGAGGTFVPATALGTLAHPDATAPDITREPAVIGLSDRLAVVRWTTDEIADSVVRFGPAGQPLTEIAGDIRDVADHTVVLTNLSPATAYDCQVSSTDPAGNGPAQSAVLSFTTAAAPDGQGPAFTVAPDAVTVAGDSVVIEWRTDEPSTTEVIYGTAAGALDRQAAFPGIGLEHAVTVNGLEPCTTYHYAALARDLAGTLSVSATQSFDTTCPNRAPVAADDAAATDEDTPVAIDVLANDGDPDGDPLLIVDPPSGCVLVVGVPCTLPYAPPAGFCGTDTVSYTISDGEYSATAQVTVSVACVADPPTAIALAPAVAGLPENVPPPAPAGTLATTDPEEGDHTYELVAGEGDEDNARFQVLGGGQLATAAALDHEERGLCRVRVRSTNTANGLWVEQTFAVPVADVNEAPELEAIGARAAAEGEAIEIALRGSDPDAGAALTFGIAGQPAGAEFDAAAGSFRWTPGYEQAGTHLVTFRVSDGSLADEETVAISVGPTNRPPAVEPPADQWVEEGELLEIAVVGADPDGDGLAWAVAGLPDGAVFDMGVGMISWRPRLDQAGVYEGIAVTATDALGASGTATFSITVEDPSGPIFVERFDNGSAAGDPEWARIAGNWSGSGGVFTARSLKSTNLSQVRVLSPASFPLGAGVVSARVRLPAVASAPRLNGMIVFAFQDATHYRYVRVTTTQVVIGQRGTLDGIGAGMKRSVRLRQAPGRWYAFTVAIHPDGRVRVYRGRGTAPVVSCRFLGAALAPSVVPGGVGLGSVRSATSFDNVTVHDDSFLIQ